MSSRRKRIVGFVVGLILGGVILGCGSESAPQPVGEDNMMPGMKNMKEEMIRNYEKTYKKKINVPNAPPAKS
jgi:hypothetical protein